MKKIIKGTRGEIPALVDGKKCAVLAFGTPFMLEGALLKNFGPADGRKGFEMLKRWCSTSSFEAVVLAGFDAAFKTLDKAHATEWLQDHADEPDFPLLIIEGDITDPDLEKLL